MPNKSLLAICVTIIVSLFLISRTGFTIRNTGGTVDSSGQVSDSISVSGDGEVFAKPDMATFTLTFSELGNSSRDALEKVNEKISQSLKMIKDAGIPDQDVTTSQFNVYPEYDYSGSYRRLLGQRATESISVNVKKIDAKASKVTSIIDQVSQIDNVQLSGVSFDIEDKSKLFEQARELAFNKAKAKASQLAKLAGVSLRKPVSISDTNYDISPRPYLENVAFKTMNSAAVDQSVQISTGQLSVKANLSILWGIN